MSPPRSQIPNIKKSPGKNSYWFKIIIKRRKQMLKKRKEKMKKTAKYLSLSTWVLRRRKVIRHHVLKSK